MKRIFASLLALFSFLVMFNACSTDVDLYADYKDITVVYGLLDSGADTNFIKINKAFLGPGNALQIAQISDSCNYPGKLDAKLIEYRASAGGTHYQQIAEFPLDTITVHDKEPGIFYAPDQKVYYTTSKIKKNDSQYKYRYELQIDHGDSLISAVTNIVGGGSFSTPHASMTFSPTATSGNFTWYPCPNASLYEVVFKFHFIELGPSQDSVERVMTWALGTYPESQLHNENGLFSLRFNPSLFYYNLATMLGSDTLNPNIERLIYEPSLEVSIAAGGDELYNFITVNSPSNSIVQTLPEYTNVKGGYGVLSSRTMYIKWMAIANTITELKNRENWHFRQIK